MISSKSIIVPLIFLVQILPKKVSKNYSLQKNLYKNSSIRNLAIRNQGKKIFLKDSK